MKNKYTFLLSNWLFTKQTQKLMESIPSILLCMSKMICVTPPPIIPAVQFL